MANMDEILAKRFDRFLQRLSCRFNEFCKTTGAVVIRAIAKLTAVIITIFIIFHEFPELSQHPNFLMLLMTWGLYGVMVFFLDCRQAKEKPTSEKIDELIEEFKGIREDLANIFVVKKNE